MPSSEFYRCSKCDALMSEDKKTCGNCTTTPKKKPVKKKAKRGPGGRFI